MSDAACVRVEATPRVTRDGLVLYAEAEAEDGEESREERSRRKSSATPL